MTCRVCPARKFCFDKGDCDDCDFGKAFESLNKKNKRLKEKNKALEAENKELKERIETILHPDF